MGCYYGWDFNWTFPCRHVPYPHCSYTLLLSLLQFPFTLQSTLSTYVLPGYPSNIIRFCNILVIYTSVQTFFFLISVWITPSACRNLSTEFTEQWNSCKKLNTQIYNFWLVCGLFKNSEYVKKIICEHEAEEMKIRNALALGYMWRKCSSILLQVFTIS